MPLAAVTFRLAPALLWPLLLTGCADERSDTRERGRQLLVQYQCASCHSIPEVPGGRGGVGPPLEHFGARSYIAGHIPNDRATLARWIGEPAALVPGTLMPDMGVSDDDARAMAAYLSSLR